MLKVQVFCFSAASQKKCMCVYVCVRMCVCLCVGVCAYMCVGECEYVRGCGCEPGLVRLCCLSIF